MVSRSFRRNTPFALTLGSLFLAAISCAHCDAQMAPVVGSAVVSAKPSSTPAAAKPAADGTQEHLQVWGKWKIVVRNPDGTTASTTEFENSLFDGGLTAAELLDGAIVPNQWNIGLLSGVISGTTPPNGSTTGPCVIATGAAGFCWIVANPNAAFANGNTLCTIYGKTGDTCAGTGLTTSITGSAFQLTGGFTATSTGCIGGVSTAIVYCSSDSTTTLSPTTVTTTSPSTCASGTISNYRRFTQALAGSTNPPFTAIAVTSGQIIQVTVAISFS